jgi:hypothetical protein
MSSIPSSLDFGDAVQSFGRLLWVGHGLLIILIVAAFQLSLQSEARAGSAQGAAIRPQISQDGIAAATANRTGPSADVRPRGYIVCSQREVREARAEIPRWTFGYIALRGVTPEEDIARLVEMGASGQIDLINYEC